MFKTRLLKIPKSFFLSLFILFSYSVNGELLCGKVIKVFDGDTIQIIKEDYTKVKVRLSGIDSPEYRQSHWKKAKKYLSSLILTRHVIVEATKEDRYGRLIGKVIYKNNDINLKMLEAGYAWHYKRYQQEQSSYDRQLYSQAEINAQKSQLGIFQDSQPTPPWLWRQKK